MRRSLLLVVVAVAAFAPPARAGSPGPPRTTAAKFAGADAVVRGKVTAVAADPVAVAWPRDEKTKVTYRVATVAVETAFAGADGRKEVKVGFEPPIKIDPKNPPRRAPEPRPELKPGQDLLLFLGKHPTADLYVLPAMSPPTDAASAYGKLELEAVRTFAAVLADPLKGLKSDKKAVRVTTATLLLTKYGTAGDFVIEAKRVAIPAEESDLIFAALLEADWSATAVRPGYAEPPPPLVAFGQLYLSEKDGWRPPEANAAVDDYGLLVKDAFAKWRTGPGKDYRIKKSVPRKAAEK